MGSGELGGACYDVKVGDVNVKWEFVYVERGVVLCSVVCGVCSGCESKVNGCGVKR